MTGWLEIVNLPVVSAGIALEMKMVKLAAMAFAAVPVPAMRLRAALCR
jgi:hypothetical protein